MQLFELRDGSVERSQRKLLFEPFPRFRYASARMQTVITRMILLFHWARGDSNNESHYATRCFLSSCFLARRSSENPAFSLYWFLRWPCGFSDNFVPFFSPSSGWNLKKEEPGEFKIANCTEQMKRGEIHQRFCTAILVSWWFLCNCVASVANRCGVTLCTVSQWNIDILLIV